MNGLSCRWEKKANSSQNCSDQPIKKWEEKVQLLFCITFNAWDVRSHKLFLNRYLMQTDGWTTNKSHQISSFLNQMANTRPDPGREWKSQMYCFGSVGIRWWLCCQKQATEAPLKFEQLQPHLILPSSQRRKFCPHTCSPLEEAQGIYHMKLPPGRKACNYHLSVKLLQFVCLLTGILNGLESTFNTVQPVFTVGLLKGNNITARTGQRLTACTRASIQQHSLTYNQA